MISCREQLDDELDSPPNTSHFSKINISSQIEIDGTMMISAFNGIGRTDAGDSGYR